VACRQQYWPGPARLVEAVPMKPNSSISFEDQVALVTGAAGGLGLAYSRLLAQRGAHVVMQDVGAALDGTGTDPRRIDQAVARLHAQSLSVEASHHGID